MTEYEIHNKILLIDELYMLVQCEYDSYKHNVKNTDDRNEFEIHMIKYYEFNDRFMNEKMKLVGELIKTLSGILEYYFKYPDICMSKLLNETIKKEYQVNFSHLPTLAKTDFTVNEILKDKTELVISEFIKYAKPNYNNSTHKIEFKFSRFTSRRYACLYSDGIWDCMMYTNGKCNHMFKITSLTDLLIILDNIETSLFGLTDNYMVSVY